MSVWEKDIRCSVCDWEGNLSACRSQVVKASETLSFFMYFCPRCGTLLFVPYAARVAALEELSKQKQGGGHCGGAV